jgi:hypothetical protein
MSTFFEQVTGTTKQNTKKKPKYTSEQLERNTKWIHNKIKNASFHKRNKVKVTVINKHNSHNYTINNALLPPVKKQLIKEGFQFKRCEKKSQWMISWSSNNTYPVDYEDVIESMDNNLNTLTEKYSYINRHYKHFLDRFIDFCGFDTFVEDVKDDPVVDNEMHNEYVCTLDKLSRKYREISHIYARKHFDSIYQLTDNTITHLHIPNGWTIDQFKYVFEDYTKSESTTINTCISVLYTIISTRNIKSDGHYNWQVTEKDRLGLFVWFYDIVVRPVYGEYFSEILDCIDTEYSKVIRKYMHDNNLMKITNKYVCDFIKEYTIYYIITFLKSIEDLDLNAESDEYYPEITIRSTKCNNTRTKIKRKNGDIIAIQNTIHTPICTKILPSKKKTIGGYILEYVCKNGGGWKFVDIAKYILKQGWKYEEQVAHKMWIKLSCSHERKTIYGVPVRLISKYYIGENEWDYSYTINAGKLLKAIVDDIDNST